MDENMFGTAAQWKAVIWAIVIVIVALFGLAFVLGAWLF